MSKKNLVALVVVTLGTLFAAGCTNDATGEPDVVETEKRASTQAPTPSDEPATATAAPSDTCPFVGGDEALIRCPCGVCAVATSCNDVCEPVPPVGAFHDALPWLSHTDGDLKLSAPRPF